MSAQPDKQSNNITVMSPTIWPDWLGPWQRRPKTVYVQRWSRVATGDLESQPRVTSHSRRLRVATEDCESQQLVTSRKGRSRLVMVWLRVATWLATMIAADVVVWSRVGYRLAMSDTESQPCVCNWFPCFMQSVSVIRIDANQLTLSVSKFDHIN